MSSLSLAQSGFNEIRDKSGNLVGTYKESHALLIGVSEYQDPSWPNLRSIPRELNDVESALKEQGFQVKKVMNPTSRELKNSFEDFINDHGFDSQNRLLIFFSGHGHSRLDGEKGYIVPSDAPHVGENERGFLRKAITMKQVMVWADNIESKHALFLFDSCFSGTLFQSRDGVSEHPPDISKATSAPVRQFITAGEAGQKVPAKSIFTPAFVGALQGKGDLDRDGYVTGTELGIYLHKTLVNYEVDQTPQYGKTLNPRLNRGDFVFALSSTLSKKDKWKKIKDSTSIVELLEFLGENPNSPYREAAKQKIEELRNRQEELKRKKEIEKEIEKASWDAIKDTRNARVLKSFLERYPNSSYSEVAKLRLLALQSTSSSVPQPTPVLEPTPTPTPKSQPTSVPIASVSLPGFVLIKPGSFLMGSENGDDDEKPVKRVEVPYSFWIGEHEVTVKEYREFVEATGHREPRCSFYPNWGESGREDHPINCVSWEDAQKYIGWRNQIDLGGKTRKNRLCTEAEWEYAARGGTQTTWSCGNREACVKDMAWYYENAWNNTDRKGTRSVKSKTPNQWKIYDMYGNVWEWVEDFYCPYTESLHENLERKCSASSRVIRGGGFNYGTSYVRSAYRDGYAPSFRNGYVGFRLCRSM